MKLTSWMSVTNDDVKIGEESNNNNAAEVRREPKEKETENLENLHGKTVVYSFSSSLSLSAFFLSHSLCADVLFKIIAYGNVSDMCNTSGCSYNVEHCEISCLLVVDVECECGSLH